MDNVLEEEKHEMPAGGDTKQWLSKLLEAPIMQVPQLGDNFKMAKISNFKFQNFKLAKISKCLKLNCAAHHLDPWTTLLQETDP